MNDRLIDVTGGYGTVYKEVMKTPKLSIEAKAIYSYLSSYAGGKDTAFPSVDLICHELNISENRFRKYKDELVNQKVIDIKRQRTDNGFSKNIYTINHHFVSRQFVGIRNVGIQNLGLQNVGIQNKGTKNNSIKNNKEKNNSSSGINATAQQPPSQSSSNVFNFYQTNGFGILQPTIIEQINAWIDDFNGNEKIIIEALKEVATNNVYKWAYVNSILKNWYQDGIKSVEDIEARRRQREAISNRSKSNSSSYLDKLLNSEDETFDNSQYKDLF